MQLKKQIFSKHVSGQGELGGGEEGASVGWFSNAFWRLWTLLPPNLYFNKVTAESCQKISRPLTNVIVCYRLLKFVIHETCLLIPCCRTNPSHQNQTEFHQHPIFVCIFVSLLPTNLNH